MFATYLDLLDMQMFCLLVGFWVNFGTNFTHLEDPGMIISPWLITRNPTISVPNFWCIEAEDVSMSGGQVKLT